MIYTSGSFSDILRILVVEVVSRSDILRVRFEAGSLVVPSLVSVLSSGLSWVCETFPGSQTEILFVIESHLSIYN